ncbi:MAG: PAS domain S-box protein [Nitrospirae bacterium]|nr:PAS domain S-box protein [Nitrospirota bacterium]
MDNDSLSGKLESKIMELDELKEKISSSVRHYKNLFGSMRDVVVIADLNRNILDANQPALRNIFGYELEEVIGKKGRILYADDEGYELTGKEVFDTMEFVEGRIMEVSLRRKNGEIFIGEVQALKLVDDQGHLSGNIGMIRDITSRKHMEDMLRNSEERYRRITEAITDYIYTVRVENGRSVDTRHSEACFAVTGYTSREFAQDPYLWIRMVLEEDHDLVRKQAEQVLSGQTPQTIEHRIVRKDSVVRWVESIIVPYKNASGALISYDGIVRDISERRKAEEALQESEERLRTIFDNSPVGISVASAEGKLVRTNPAFRKMLGYTEDELVRDFADITHRDDLEKNMRMFKEMVYGKRNHYWLEKRYIRKDGGILWAHTTVTAIRDHKGAFKYNFAIIEDMTERKKLEDQLRHAQKMEAIGQLAGGVAHDFNNMLTAIIGYGHLLKLKLKDNAPLLHIIEQILSITERGATLTKDLLAFSRKQAVVLKPVRLNNLVDRIGKLMPKFIGEDIELRITLTDKPLIVLADSSQIEHVLINLATNARDAMSEGGTLSIETEQVSVDHEDIKQFEYGAPGVYALISVSDTGTGMDKETLRKIYDPFFTTKEVGKGTGLGLAMTYGIIKQHNGYINAYSEPGLGTMFKIHLPLIKDDVEELKPVVVPAPVKGSETILLAEDEAEVRNAIKNNLEEFGYTVIEAVNGADAVDKFAVHQGKIQLLIFDVVMPKKNGMEAYEEIRKIRPDIKIIFLSGYTGDILNSKGLPEKGLNFLLKPVLPQDLLNNIREVIGK